jgi:hypothetical protein
MRPISSLERRPLSLVIVMQLDLQVVLSTADIKDTISTNVKGDFDLGNTTMSGRDVGQFKLAKQVVAFVCARAPS